MYSKNLNFVQIKKIVRATYGAFFAIFTYPIAWFWFGRPTDALALAVAEILLFGFYGSTTKSLSARLLAKQVKRGQVNHVFFVNQNIGSKAEIRSLVALFKKNQSNTILAIDHEGGVVQRLTKVHDFSTLPSARDMASQFNPNNAKAMYQLAGQELRGLGFNMNLGPVLDFDHPQNEAIGIFGRSFGVDPSTIYNYGKSFIDGFTSAGVICSLKHFPGHGHSIGDSHFDPANITHRWTAQELEPFARLIATNRAPSIMVGHLRLDTVDPTGAPATISYPIITGLLRNQLQYQGVVLTDDLDMGAVGRIRNRRDAIIQALVAGNDLLMIKNLYGYDPLLPQRALYWIRQAIKKGQLQEAQILKAAQRVRALQSL